MSFGGLQAGPTSFSTVSRNMSAKERSREELKDKLDDYWVYAIDGGVHGCAALHPAGEHAGEIAGLAVDPRCAQLGIGAKLLTRLTEKAAETGTTRLFALTTRTPHSPAVLE